MTQSSRSQRIARLALKLAKYKETERRVMTLQQQTSSLGNVLVAFNGRFSNSSWIYLYRMQRVHFNINFI